VRKEVAHADGSFGRVLLKRSRIDVLLWMTLRWVPLKTVEVLQIETEEAKSPKPSMYQAAIATPKRRAMKAACPKMSPFGNHRTCPLRTMFTISIP